MIDSSLPSFDLVVGGLPRFRAEAPWAWRLLTRYLRELPAAFRVEAPGRELLVSDAGGVSEIVLVHADPEAYLLPEVGARLLAALAGHPESALVLPVSNESESEETRRAPPFAYLTPTLLAEAVAFLARDAAPLRPVRAAASPVYAIRRTALRALPPDLPLRRVPERAETCGLAAAVDPGAYVHRYGEMDASAREDLAARVPRGARAVLDVGCSRGATAPALRERGVERIVGIEPDLEDAAAAAQRYDEVLTSRLEEAEELRERFDAILFGDVLEHLEDPSDALVRVRPWLATGGVVIASVPNVGHWTVIDDLLRGRFDYVPYSLLSGTHIRFFTRRTLEDLFEASGYRVASIETVTVPPSPLGEARLARLRAFPSASPDLEVSEFLAVARPDGA
jgi:2-polyprenyl-3-methyl-5-hydroxy-6-metoxy-1,4-benzoquinol methylase